MTPDIDLQLAVAIKALIDVVTPAVDAANPMAREQLRLAILTLEHVKARHAYQPRRARRELANALELAADIQDIIGSARIEAARKAAAVSLADLSTSTSDLKAATERLLVAIDATLDQLTDRSMRKRCDRAVLKGAKAQFDLNRSWFLRTGREQDALIPQLEDLI
ncbi:hypothetical protein Sphch_1882 [Sphingobium chlorophenolicum L-1]|uniref:Uncharacterized protein n=1 Tax=Sphingobium chlorophenolicum L-1 TaxID=690566 RepID=F6EUB0_SPHCR|nr:hypothetical protein [Sphingobium chlorophenolicum]AEG49563.1 hypothetical protein Sphch_1882 [Sphingobium chlorophenolicum L-1]